jgi:nucleotide-binding universal stress UspA family protein
MNSRPDDEAPRIVVGVDGSGHSRRALKWAMREAAVRHVPLTVITAHEISVGYWGSAVVYPEDHAVAEHARRAVQLELGESRPESVTVQVVSGTPAHELLSTARDADMIVVGSRGAGRFAQLVMGSVSTQVSRHAHCPVAVIPPVLAWPGNGRPGGGQVT